MLVLVYLSLCFSAGRICAGVDENIIVHMFEVWPQREAKGEINQVPRRNVVEPDGGEQLDKQSNIY